MLKTWRQGFTLIELLIVMAILGVMMAIIVVSGGMVTATQVAMASKDTLRLARYARNMALQTQQPVTLSFAPGMITLDTPFDAETAPKSTSTEEPLSSDSDADVSTEKPKGNALHVGDIEAVGLVKYYENVAFKFVSFDDSIKMGRSADKSTADFQRRVAGEADETVGETTRQQAEAFSITIRANGTTRPFTICVYDQEGSEETGNTITFDFLCSGTISDKER
ncbi:MAG: prepilin-type N-terminal cleavage/methylation domain-containing protein [Kiritimatiellae bacterium]|nr:prepilin-type N-terminal cleavage/methylation domain-containing protein [Kiritimatiellia bacterium]